MKTKIHKRKEVKKKMPNNKNAQVEAPTAALIELSPVGTPEGYTPKEAAAIFTANGFPTDGKKVRRLLRGAKMEGTLWSGRWYIPVKAVEDLVARLKARVQEQAEPAAS